MHSLSTCMIILIGILYNNKRVYFFKFKCFSERTKEPIMYHNMSKTTTNFSLNKKNIKY